MAANRVPGRPGGKQLVRRLVLPLLAGLTLLIGIAGPASAAGSADGSLDVFGSSSGSASLGSSGDDGDEDGDGDSGDGEGQDKAHDPIDADEDSNWAPDEPIENNIVPRDDTVIVEPEQVESIDGDYGEDQTIVYTRDDEDLPAEGGQFVVNAGGDVEYGTIGAVTNVDERDNDQVRVQIDPATIDDAYSEFEVNTTVEIDDQQTGPQTRSAPMQPQASKLGIPEFKCESGVEPPFTIEGGIKDLEADVEFSADPEWGWTPEINPYFRSVFSGTAYVEGMLESSAQVECKTKGGGITVPVAGPMSVKVEPQFSLDFSAEQQASVEWNLELEEGFEVKGSDGRRVTSYDNSVDVDMDEYPTLDAEIAGGFAANLGLNTPSAIENVGGTAEGGAKLEAGPHLKLKEEGDDGCYDATYGADADFSLNSEFGALGIDKEWSKTLGGMSTGDKLLTSFCFQGDDNDGDDDGSDDSVAPSENTSIASGTSHSCAVLESGTVKCWGSNLHGMLGDGTSEDSSTPVTVEGIDDATAVTADIYHSCALLESGTIKCWGFNPDGQLGDGTTDDSSTPVTVDGIDDATAISGSCAVLESGTVKCWGGNDAGQLGDGTTDDSSTPVTVDGIDDATAIADGRAHSCALLDSGTVQCWGYNGAGQLGDGTTDDSSTPVTVDGIDDATAVTAGRAHSCAVLASGAAQCWGSNGSGEGSGQLGDGTADDSATPVRVDGIDNAVQPS